MSAAVVRKKDFLNTSKFLRTVGGYNVRFTPVCSVCCGAGVLI